MAEGHGHPLILYIKATVSVCLCGEFLEDYSSHCPFPRNNSFEHTEQGVLNCLSFWPPGVCLHWGASPKPRHGIFKDMIFRTWDFSFGTYTVWVSKTQTWKFFGHDFQDVGSSVFGDLEFALRVSKTQKDLGNFRIWFSRHGFQDLGSQLWGLGNFRISFLGHGFQNLGSQLWGLGNFRISFSGHGFQDLGSQLWGLDFHTHGFQDWNLKTFRTWFSGCGISI